MNSIMCPKDIRLGVFSCGPHQAMCGSHMSSNVRIKGGAKGKRGRMYILALM